MAAPPKVPVYSQSDLKNTSDDAISSYLTTLPQPYTFSRVYTKTDVHLVLGYSAVAIAGATFYADRMLGWDATVAPWVIIAVIAYFTLNSILSYWTWAVEAGEVFQGRRKTGETVTIKSSSKKLTALYKLKVTYTSPGGRTLQEKEIETSFTTWFSSDGTFHQECFRRWFAGEFEVLGLAAKETSKKTGAASSLVGVDERKGNNGGKRAAR
ncbi:putative signal peptidase [Elaphomyces granulatus]|jgi:hypothetical protein